MLIVMTIESLRDEIDTLVELKQGFVAEGNKQSAERTQRMIYFKQEQIMQLLRSNGERLEIRV